MSATAQSPNPHDECLCGDYRINHCVPLPDGRLGCYWCICNEFAAHAPNVAVLQAWPPVPIGDTP